jgi:hypothetical protein
VLEKIINDMQALYKDEYSSLLKQCNAVSVMNNCGLTVLSELRALKEAIAKPGATIATIKAATEALKTTPAQLDQMEWGWMVLQTVVSKEMTGFGELLQAKLHSELGLPKLEELQSMFLSSSPMNTDRQSEVRKLLTDLSKVSFTVEKSWNISNHLTGKYPQDQDRKLGGTYSETSNVASERELVESGVESDEQEEVEEQGDGEQQDEEEDHKKRARDNGISANYKGNNPWPNGKRPKK